VLDLSSSADVSQDGKLLLFNEFGQGGGVKGRAYVRGTDGSPPIKLTEGGAMSLSPDGMRAMLMPRGAEVPIVPVRAESRSASDSGGNTLLRELVSGRKTDPIYGKREARWQARVFVLDETTGKSRPITEEGVRDDTLDRNRRSDIT